MQTVPLTNLMANLDSGARPPGGAGASSDGIPSLGAEHLADDGGFFLDNLKTVPELFFNEMTKGHICKDDILIVKDGATTGKASFVNGTFPFKKAAVNEHVFRLTVDKARTEPAYVFRFIASDIGKRQILKDFRGATVGGISRGFTEMVHVPIPFPDDPRRSLAEQKRIAAILDKADAIRRRRQEAARLADTLIPSVFYEMFGDPATNPKRFPIRTFDEVIADTQYGTATKADTHGRGLPVLRMNNITNDGNFDLSDLKWLELIGDDADHYTLAKGDLLFNRTNSPELVGKTAVWKSEKQFAFAGYLIRVRFHPKSVAPDYVSAYLNSRYGKQMLRAHAQPSINMSNISASTLRRMSIMMPPITLQHEFAKQIDELAKFRQKNERQIGDVELLFNALVQRAFRGEL